MIKLKNKTTPDTILKNFWNDNERFADLFNAFFFNGDPMLNPKDHMDMPEDELIAFYLKNCQTRQK